MSSPTARSLQHLRKTCSFAEVVEKWVPCSPAGFKGAIIRRDLWGFDIAFLREGEFGLCQTTSDSNMNARIRKIADLPSTSALRKANVRLLVHGWGKKGKVGTRKTWKLREVDIS